MTTKALVSDASDKKQIKNAEQREQIRRDRELSDIATVAATVEGRRLLWRILSKCRTFETVWENSARIHYNAGQQDLGHFLIAEIVETNEEILFQMMKESKKEQV